MKKGKIVLSILFILLFFTSFSFAVSNCQYVFVNIDGKNQKLRQVSVLVDGQAISGDISPFIYNNRILVPVRYVAEELGMDVKWNQKDKTVAISEKGKEILLKIDSPYAYVNKKEQILPDKVAPKLVNNRTMIPIRFVSETIGYKIGWDGENSIAYIETNANSLNKDEEKNVNITQVFTEKDSTDVTKIIINGTEPIEYKTLVLESPCRLVIDMPDTVLNLSENYTCDNGIVTIFVNEELISKVCLSQFSKNPDITRVVIHLNKESDWNIKKLNRGEILEVSFLNKVEDIVKDENIELIDFNERLIVVDPGHGGIDPGTVSPNGTKEKDIALSIALKLNEKLVSKGYNTFMIRDEDCDVDKYERAKVANSNNAYIYVSIHCNSGISTASGIETLYCPMGSKKCQALDKDNYTLAKAIQDELIKGLNAVDRGVKERSDLVVLNSTQMPAVLVETGFLSNSEDEVLLIDSEYQDRIAECIMRGIEEYFNGTK